MIPQSRKCQERGVERSLPPAQEVMHITQSVNREPRALRACAGGRPHAFLGEVSSAGLDCTIHPRRSNCGDDFRPIRAEIRFATNQSHIPGSQRRQIVNQSKTLCRGQLRWSSPARTRPTVLAGEITRERALPHHTDGNPSALIALPRVSPGNLIQGGQRSALFIACSSLEMAAFKSPCRRKIFRAAMSILFISLNSPLTITF